MLIGLIARLNQHRSEELLALSRKETNARKRMRLLAVSLFLGGDNRTNIAKRLNVARASVNKWGHSYLADGLAGLNNRRGAGRSNKLTPQQFDKLSHYISKHAKSSDGGRLTGADIVQYIQKEFNVRYSPGHIYKVLKSLGYSWITTRSKHPKQSQEAQDAFKKVQAGNDPPHSI